MIVIHISEKFNLKINGHEDINFIDIDEREDVKLFIDPYVIQALPDEFCISARKSIDTFFQEVFRACREKNHDRLRSILKHASEPNETNLGLKRIGKYGKGSSNEELSKLFLDFYKIVRKNPYIETNPTALCMYIKNFDKDKMSDLITNIIRKHLYDFTVEQSVDWGMELASNEKLIGYYWDRDNLDWNSIYGRPLSVGQKDILLVPKYIVRSRYVFSVESYIRQYILKIIQKDHLDRNSDMCIPRVRASGRIDIIPPTIKTLYKKEVYGNVRKDYAFYHSVKNKNVEDIFFKGILRRIKNGYGSITDERLDEIVYKKNIRSVSI